MRLSESYNQEEYFGIEVQLVHPKIDYEKMQKVRIGVDTPYQDKGSFDHMSLIDRHKVWVESYNQYANLYGSSTWYGGSSTWYGGSSTWYGGVRKEGK